MGVLCLTSTSHADGFNYQKRSPLINKGEIYVRTATSDVALPVGANGTVLSADSSTVTGLKWVAVSGGAGTVTNSGTLTSNAVIIGQGTTVVAAITADTGVTHALFATATSPAFRQVTSADVNGTQSVAQGGTGITSGVANALVYFQTTGLIGTLTADTTAGHVLVSTTTLPNFRQLLSSDVSGTHSVAQGGTGITSGTANGVVIFSTTGLMASTTADSAATGHFFSSSAGQPAFRQVLTSDVNGTIGSNNGGTGLTTNTKGDIMVSNGASWQKLAVAADGQVLTTDSASANGIKWITAPAAGGSTTPGGANLQMQFNNSNAFGGATLLTTDAAGDLLHIGLLTSPVVSLDVTGNFRTVPFALTDGAAVSLDVSRSNQFTLILGGSRTVSNPTNCTFGQTFILMVSQDATGSRKLGFQDRYRFGIDVPSFDASTTAGMQDLIGFRCNDKNSADVVSVVRGFK